MKRLIRAELLKLRTTRTFWWTIAVTLAFTPLSVFLSVQSAGDNGTAPLDSTEGFRNVIAAASSGGILMIVIGIIALAGEYRFNTITSTLLVTPNRRRMLGAKLATIGLVGLGVGIASALLTLVVALPWLASRDVDLGAHGTDIVVVVLGSIGATAIGGIVGVGIGALVTNQTVAITVALIWTLLVESMLTNFASDVGRWFPGGAASAMSGVAPANGDLLPMWAAALVFAGYGLAFATVGSRFVLDRDVP